MSSTLSLILKHIPDCDYVFCDLDGTLIDSESFRISTYYDSLKELGFPYKELPLNKLIGNHPKVNLTLISPNISDPDIDLVLHHRNKKLSKFLPGSINLIPSVYSILEKHFKNIVLVTNSTEEYAKSIVQYFNLKVASIVCCESISGLHPKPSPSLYTYSFQSFLPPPSPSIVLEDSPAGLKAASLAGSDYIINIKPSGEATLFHSSC